MVSAPTALAPYVVLKKAEEITGYTVKAMERKIERGEWVEGREWRKAPDGRRLLSVEGYRAWVERGRA
ncbi:excisionase [Rubrivivax rivuli]|uniref:Excisionase n=1 Tax=Rubrivivax rivuli TaxID=1862385 RepID=A0A437RFX4_9BURK|nr:excisionase [Rubrivivax rivuli]